MCGRYVSVTAPEQLAEHFEVDEVRTESLGERYNVAPTLDVYAIVEHDGRRLLGTLHWGLVPFWAEGPKQGPTPINARIESIRAKRMFRDSFRRRRCILPADGFYEWQARPDAGRKQPYYLHDPQDRPLALAGIWSRWRPRDEPEAEPLSSCAIVTTAAQGRARELHDRMPVMLPERLWARWLSAEPRQSDHLQARIAGLDAPALDAYPVTERVNNVRNNGADLLAPAGDALRG